MRKILPDIPQFVHRAMETSARKILDYGYGIIPRQGRLAVLPNKTSGKREEKNYSTSTRNQANTASLVKNYSQQSRYSVHEIETDFWMGSLSTATDSVLAEMNVGLIENKRDNLILIHHSMPAIAQWESALQFRCSVGSRANFLCLHVENWLDQSVLTEALLELAERIQTLLSKGERVILLEAPVSRHSEVVAAILLEGGGRRTQKQAVAHLSLCSCARGSDTRQRLAAALAWREMRNSPLFQSLPEGAQLKILDLL
uniref:Uncharacterized protein n=1 Tax=Cryptomonas curvata TaxID=233186 RepID=A0A7S0QSE0_9CRYP|mmetsp:Transcript_49521/g.103303  ORF Transcript_49521/g.103303 Transcript_49521/m.103303 type:complete len:257 (+) Transcript_49521:12-782(+)